MKQSTFPPLITAIDHVQLAGPVGCEEAARNFYVDLLGMTEITKPAALQARGGAWFQIGNIQVHIGIEVPFVAAKKAHPAFSVTNLEALRHRLEAVGVSCINDLSIPGVDRFYTNDPCGNRLEFVQQLLPAMELLKRYCLSVVPLSSSTLPSAKYVIAAGVKEFFLKPGETDNVESIVTSYDERGLFDDLNSYQTTYGPTHGLFLVLLDNKGDVVGMGGVRRISDSIAELKRMWYLPEYRGRGLGRMLATQLIDFARHAGYTSIRLDSGSNLQQALALYQKLGFQPIENYNGSPHCDIFMELTL